jgi:chromosomal replication initiator protein
MYKKAYQYILLSEDKIKEIAEARIQSVKKRLGFNPEMIVDLVCDKTNTARKDILGKGRKSNFIMPRHLCMVLLFEVLNLPKSQIGRIFNANHSTVIHAIESFHLKLKQEPSWEELYRSIKHQISFQ